MISKITSKYQITIPKKIRNKLKLKIHGFIKWEENGGTISVKAAESPILKYRNSIKTGKGNIDKDIETVRSMVAEKNK